MLRALCDLLIVSSGFLLVCLNVAPTLLKRLFQGSSDIALGLTLVLTVCHHGYFALSNPSDSGE